MQATYEGKCGVCQGTIEAGEEIVKIEGEWVHEECASEWTDDEWVSPFGEV